MKQKPEGTKTLHFRAENVHDFAWCADPTFVVEDTTVAGVELRSFYRRSSRKAWADSTLAHGLRALAWLNEKVGPYPYPQITIVEMLRGGGMEYPMLVMDGRADESLVLHEIGHLYFYGVLANDEQAEAWMDEGFTVFQTRWYYEEKYGPWGDRAKLNWYQRMTPQYKLWEAYRKEVTDLQRRGYGERVSTRADEYEHNYATHVYRKSALVLHAVKYALGDSTFSAMLHEYYSRNKFKHVTENDFREAVENFAHMDLRHQFDQWLHTKKIVDYKLDGVRTHEADGRVLTQVNIKREGELFLPIELHFEMPDGSVEKRRVDGKLRTISETFSLPAKPRSVAINPDNEIMDIDPADNRSPRRRQFMIDWPNNNYFAEDAYTIRHHPFAWYNRVDEARLGWHASGSYYDWARRTKLGLYYGVKSERLDFSASFDKPIVFMGARGRLEVSGFKLEGRQSAEIAATLRKRPRHAIPPTHLLRVAYNYYEVMRPEYLARPTMYDTTRADVGVEFNYNVDPQLDIAATNINAGLRLGRKWTGGKNKYERFTTEATLHSRTEYFPVDLRLRGFVGLAGGDVPRQQKFGLADAGSIARDRRFFLRSEDAIPDDLNYHEPGDGNLRGYTAGTFGVDKLLAFNVEAGTKLPLWKLSKPVSRLVGPVSWYVFYDVGKALDDTNPMIGDARVQSFYDAGVATGTLQDAGIGFRSHTLWPFWKATLRLDMPLWVSQPSINGEMDTTQFRYVFSLSTAF